MKHRQTTLIIRWALVIGAAAGAAAATAAPMSVEAQALAHWVHYTRLNDNRTLAEVPFIVVDQAQLRWWLVDSLSRRLDHGPALLLQTDGWAPGQGQAVPEVRPLAARDGG